MLSTPNLRRLCAAMLALVLLVSAWMIGGSARAAQVGLDPVRYQAILSNAKTQFPDPQFQPRIERAITDLNTEADSAPSNSVVSGNAGAQITNLGPLGVVVLWTDAQTPITLLNGAPPPSDKVYKVPGFTIGEWGLWEVRVAVKVNSGFRGIQLASPTVDPQPIPLPNNGQACVSSELIATTLGQLALQHPAGIQSRVDATVVALNAIWDRANESGNPVGNQWTIANNIPVAMTVNNVVGSKTLVYGNTQMAMRGTDPARFSALLGYTMQAENGVSRVDGYGVFVAYPAANNPVTIRFSGRSIRICDSSIDIMPKLLGEAKALGANEMGRILGKAVLHSPHDLQPRIVALLGKPGTTGWLDLVYDGTNGHLGPQWGPGQTSVLGGSKAVAWADTQRGVSASNSSKFVGLLGFWSGDPTSVAPGSNGAGVFLAQYQTATWTFGGRALRFTDANRFAVGLPLVIR